MDFFTESELACLDLDWWAMDMNGYIGHFTTAGVAPFPHQLKISSHHLLWNYFFETALVRGFAYESSEWEKISGEVVKAPFPMKSVDIARKLLLSSYQFMGERGMFSYAGYMPNGRNQYFRLIVPSSPLTIDMLPQDIKDIIQEITFPVSFSQARIITKYLITEKQ
ncbi:MAG: hypothetical protein LBG80_05740 [Bacteroidales bacterium]|jgi:hypothetical protein|nr:hypothetical protein [Bacteroidales bacterium]